MLPWRGAARPQGSEDLGDGERVSPVNASARYLAHLRAAWDAEHADDPIEDQDVLITVPASFDAIARELTVSLSTVRTHTNRIYAKLGVNNRRAAVRQAQQLDLMPRTRDR